MKTYNHDLSVSTLEEAKQKWEEISWGRTKHYKGENINNLKIEYRTNNDSYGHPRFVFKCYCGKYNVAIGSCLVDGRIKSCGCLHSQTATKNNKLKIIDITNQRFGHLVALEYTDDEEINKKTNGKAWKCQCDCGAITYVGQNTLRTKQTKSCGKISCPYSNNKTNLLGYENEYFKVIDVDIEKSENYKNLYWKCVCKNCGNITSKISSDIINKRIKSCGCIRSSAGEAKIEQILRKNNIIYEKEKTFKDCSFENNHKSHCKFDFYIPNKHYLIEYDGDIHFKYNDSGWNTEENFKKRQLLDNFKNNYCKEHNIPLIRIPYTHYDKLVLEDLLLESSKFII